MSEMIDEALNLAYGFVSSLCKGTDFLLAKNAISNIAGYENYKFYGKDNHVISYNEVQSLLSKLNERESIRKNKGVYYTPSDVVKFIVTNTIKASLGCLTPENVNCGMSTSNGYEKMCIAKTVFEPTCGAGEFLLETLEHKLSIWISHGRSCGKKNIEKIVKTIYGNDINSASIIITKLRLYICAVNKFGVRKCEGLPEIINNNFTTVDYVVSPPEDGVKYDIILGNPPYVEDSKCGLPLTVKYGNIYANILENVAKRLAKDGSMGFIIPLSYISTPRMKKIRDTLLSLVPEQYIMSYADRPDCLFDSVHQKLCILIGKNTKADEKIYTGNYQYWYQEERETLFQRTTVVLNQYKSVGFIPKLGSTMDISIYRKIIDSQKNVSVYAVSRNGKESVYLNRRETFWMKAFREPIIHSEYKVFSYETAEEADYCYCLLNSSLFWWYWIATSDCWHVSKELNGFMAPHVKDSSIAKQLAKQLRKKLEETKVFVGTKQTEYEYKHKECILEIHQIDDFINATFGLSDEESNYIKSFALKYRTSGGAASESN